LSGVAGGEGADQDLEVGPVHRAVLAEVAVGQHGAVGRAHVPLDCDVVGRVHHTVLVGVAQQVVGGIVTQREAEKFP